jgi:hypothetical protein
LEICLQQKPNQEKMFFFVDILQLQWIRARITYCPSTSALE